MTGGYRSVRVINWKSGTEPTSLALRLNNGVGLILGDSRLPDAKIGGRHDLGVDYTSEKSDLKQGV